MLDILLKFPDRQTAALVGEQLGYTTIDTETGEISTTQATLTLAICVIGSHSYPDPTDLDEEGNPKLKADNQYWVMVRSLVDMEIPPEVQPFVVERNPDDPTIPNQQWA